MSLLKPSPGSAEISNYRDQHFKTRRRYFLLLPQQVEVIASGGTHYMKDGSRTEQEQLLLQSTTLYIGNLSFYTTEEQIHELFGRCGDVKRIVMGLDKVRKTPCGFCFVEYYTRKDAEMAVRYVNGTRLDDRVVRCDWDAGFKEGRQYGRGRTGGQVRDEYRSDYDEGRGGYGKIVTSKITTTRTPQ